MSTCIPCMDGNHDNCRYSTDRDCVCRCQRSAEPDTADANGNITPIGVLLVVAAVLGLIILAGVL